MKPKLVRWRADPSKIRVAVRPHGHEFIVTLTAREGNQILLSRVVPHLAKDILAVLEEAQRLGVDGTDLGMGRSYERPYKKHDEDWAMHAEECQQCGTLIY